MYTNHNIDRNEVDEGSTQSLQQQRVPPAADAGAAAAAAANDLVSHIDDITAVKR